MCLIAGAMMERHRNSPPPTGVVSGTHILCAKSGLGASHSIVFNSTISRNPVFLFCFFIKDFLGLQSVCNVSRIFPQNIFTDQFRLLRH